MSEEYVKKYYTLSRLSRVQLNNLREDVVLCSYYANDYKNRYDIDTGQAYIFFEGYADYLGELMRKNNIDDDGFFDYLREYDTIENLWSWHGMVYQHS